MAARIIDINGKRAAAEEDYLSAERFDCVSVGSLGVYYRDLLHVKFIPYACMERVFLRIQEVNGKMCCGSTVFQYFRLVFVCGGREIADCMSENESAFRAALDKIRVAAPYLPIGVAAQGSEQ